VTVDKRGRGSDECHQVRSKGSLNPKPETRNPKPETGGVEAVMNAIKYGAKGSQGDKISLAAMGSC
jgi:hypothetical protein